MQQLVRLFSEATPKQYGMYGVLGLVLCAAPFVSAGFEPISFVYCIYALVLYVCALVDARMRSIPNLLIACGCIVWLVSVFALVFTCDIDTQVESAALVVAVQLVVAASVAGVLVGINSVCEFVWDKLLFDKRVHAATGNAVLGAADEDITEHDDAAGTPAFAHNFIGAGDIKLLFMLSLITPINALLVTLFVACAASIVYAIIMRRRTFPWAPFIAGAWYVCMFTPFLGTISQLLGA